MNMETIQSTVSVLQMKALFLVSYPIVLAIIILVSILFLSIPMWRKSNSTPSEPTYALIVVLIGFAQIAAAFFAISGFFEYTMSPVFRNAVSNPIIALSLRFYGVL